jgi:hypothetical protein
VVVGRRIARSGALGNGKRVPRPAGGGRNSRVRTPRRWNSSLCPHQGALLPSSFIAYDLAATHTGAGGARNRPISDKISANICRDTETSANWKVGRG